MPNCTVLSCKNSTKKVDRDIENISFHRFPSDPKIKWKWIEATGHKNWFPSEYSRICSVHFKEGSFKGTNKFRRLTPKAIPTIDVLQTSNNDESLHYEVIIKSEPEDDDEQSEATPSFDEKEDEEPPAKRTRQSLVAPEKPKLDTTPELVPLLQDVSSYLQSLLDKKEDAFDSFGNYVSTMLRSMPMHKVMEIKPKIINLLISNSVNPTTS